MNDDAGPSSPASRTAPTEDTPDPTAPPTDTIASHTPSFYFSRKPRLIEIIAILDRIVWAEILALYLLDNSVLRLILRASVQAVYLMPKPAGFPEHSKGPPPYIGAILGSNIICFLFHALNQPPNASEATRGYLHGSIIIDFVGQQGPTSKFRLLALDLVVFLVQLIALATVVEKQALEKSREAAGGNNATAADVNDQDHDAEERGQVRGTSGSEDEIEMQDFVDVSATDELLSQPGHDRTFAASDKIASGQSVIANLYLWDTVRHLHRAFEQRRSEGGSDARRFAFPGIRDLLNRTGG